MADSIEINLDIHNFKAIGKSQVRLRSGLNILIGPYGSGKTCIFSAFKFVRDHMALHH